MREDGRTSEELILLTKQFLAFAESQYKNKKITEQEYEGLICKKLSFLAAMENKVVCQ
ncbi:MAG: hypothetical protein H7X94_08450 [Vallitaleaceae bacterium]|nr:hypothetical protein [Vallitaleaceae bacterium]